MGNKLITVEKLSFAYGSIQILQDVSLTVEEGDYTTIIGPNGSGKTTLLNILTRQLKANTGTIRYKGTMLQDIKLRDMAKEVAVIYQNSICNFPYTCFETVLMGLHPHLSRFEQIKDKQIYEVEECMKLTGALEFANKEITNISGGELQRVLLARALVQRPTLLIIDEAMSDLDISAKIEMNQILRDMIKEKGMSILAIHHDLNLAFTYSDYIIALKKGAVAAYGSPQKLLNDQFFKSVFGVKVQIYEEDRFVIYDKV